MSIPVWVYWEGDRPEWISWCHETIRAHTDDLRLLSPEAFASLRDTDRDIDLSRLSVVHRSDYVRAFLLWRFGGLWLDSDCLLMQDLKPWLDRLRDFEFIGYMGRDLMVANNFIGAREASPIAREFYAQVAAAIRASRPLAWNTIGATTLTLTLRRLNTPWLRLGCELIQPIDWSSVSTPFERRTDSEHAAAFNDRSICYMLFHSLISPYTARHPSESLLSEGTLFRYLHKRALDGGAKRSIGRKVLNPGSYGYIPFSADLIRAIDPDRVLHVGIGVGRWGILIRELCDEMNGRVHRENWNVWLEGIEIFPAHVEEHHWLVYNHVHIGDAVRILEGIESRWDLVIIGEPAAAWPSQHAARLLERSLVIADYVLLLGEIEDSPPESGAREQDGMPSPSAWDMQTLASLAPIRQMTYRDEAGFRHGALLFSRRDPKLLNSPSGN